MPKVNLTKFDKYKAQCDIRNKRLRALIEAKMIEYSISIETLERVIGISKSSIYYRLSKPAERFNFNELCLLICALHISNEELCRLLR